ncbi:hypothetical protein KKE06_02125 [Candidatus Micrarchaeota archaeon]|nr:hypothetical protein [Candidatus Micrarchaeota archaeon]MBU1929972.1 hypothetical protein [Candidatus Micrarchaeota archaeon]
MNGTELIVRHSFAPNRLEYCGKNNLKEKIPLFLSNYSSTLEKELQEELKSFKGLYSYLSLIATANNLSPFDEKVGEAYWIGNDFLEKVSQEQVQHLFLERFSREDFLGKELAQNLVSKLPNRFFVHHSFHVFFIHFLIESLSISLQNLDNCRISWGKVLEVFPEKLLVESTSLNLKGEHLFFGKKREKILEHPFEDDVIAGDWVSFHWNTFCMKLSSTQVDKLRFFTEQNLNSFNTLE